MGTEALLLLSTSHTPSAISPRPPKKRAVGRPASEQHASQNLSSAARPSYQ
jgi:hypothetical protein